MDPITPPPLAKLIIPGFSNATYVEFPYAGHGPTRSVKCAGEFLTKFYDAPDGELDLSCPESMERPDFAGPLFKTDGLTGLVTKFAEDKKSMVLPILWIIIPALTFLLGAVLYSLAPVARILNRSGALPTGGARLVAWITSLAGAASIGGLAAGVAMAAQENALMLLTGLPGWTKLAAMAGLAAGPLGLFLLWLAFRARMAQPLPIGVTLGLFLTGASGVALAAWLAVWGFLPF